MSEQRTPDEPLMMPLINGHWPECEPPDEVGARGYCICDRKPRPMTDQELNALICKRLLGWTPSRFVGIWFVDGRLDSVATPKFETWAEAGLILDAMKNAALQPMLYFHGGACERWECSFATLSVASTYFGNTGPLAIRAAALEYIRSLP